MRLVDFVRPELVLPQLGARDKPGVLREIAEHLARQLPGVDANLLTRVLTERERLASTAFGEGVAMPHGKLDGSGRLWGCLARAPEGVDFDSMDGRPTHLFFVLIAPESSVGEHLRAIGRMSRLLKDQALRTRLIQARDGAEMYQLMADEDARL